MRRSRRAVSLTSLGFLTAALAAIGGFGCDSRSEGGVSGQKATVEERPYVNKDGTQQKQRSGILKKVTTDWVVLQEGPNEIWIPRDMVLELRVDRK